MAIQQPQFQQYTTDVGPDNSAAQLVGALGEAGMSILGGGVRSSTRKQLEALTNSIQEQQDNLSATSQLGTANMEAEAASLVAGAEAMSDPSRLVEGKPSVEVAGILLRYDAEIQELNSRLAQGVMSQSEFDIRNRAIRKRMVDKFPGLAGEIDAVYQNHTQYDERFLRTQMALDAQKLAMEQAKSDLDRLYQRAKELNVPWEGYADSAEEGKRELFMRMYADATMLAFEAQQSSSTLLLADNLAKLTGQLGPSAGYELKKEGALAAQTGARAEEQAQQQAQRDASLGNLAGYMIGIEVTAAFAHLDEKLKAEGVDRDAYLASPEGQAEIAAMSARIRGNINGDLSQYPDYYRAGSTAREMVDRMLDNAIAARTAPFGAFDPRVRSQYVSAENTIIVEQQLGKELAELAKNGDLNTMTIAMAKQPLVALQQIAALASADPLAFGKIREVTGDLIGAMAPYLMDFFGERTPVVDPTGGAKNQKQADEVLMTNSRIFPRMMENLDEMNPEGVRAVAHSLVTVFGHADTMRWANVKESTRNELLSTIGSDSFREFMKMETENNPEAAKLVYSMANSQGVRQAALTRALVISGGAGDPGGAFFAELGPVLLDREWSDELGSYRYSLKPDALDTLETSVKQNGAGAIDYGLATRAVAASATAGAYGVYVPPEMTQRRQVEAALDSLVSWANREAGLGVGNAIKAHLNVRPDTYTNGGRFALTARQEYDNLVGRLDPFNRGSEGTPPRRVRFEDLE